MTRRASQMLKPLPPAAGGHRTLKKTVSLDSGGRDSSSSSGKPFSSKRKMYVLFTVCRPMNTCCLLYADCHSLLRRAPTKSSIN